MQYFRRVANLTPTRLWINNVTRREARMAIEAGAIGSTQNPSYLSKVIRSKDDGEWIDALTDGLIAQTNDDEAVVEQLQLQVIAGICDEFLEMYEATGHRAGYVSIQANPFKENEETILQNVEAGLKLRPNFLYKIPATQAGIAVMRELFRRRIPVLATEVMSIDQVIAVCSAHRQETEKMCNPAPVWLAHINGIFDEYMRETVESQGIDIHPDVLNQASFALARKIRGYITEHNWSVGYLAGGARSLAHFTDMVGVDGSVTINWRGSAEKLLEQDGAVVDVFHSPIPFTVVDELLERLPDFRRAYTPKALTETEFETFGPVVKFRRQFENGWAQAREYVAKRRKEKE